jgi:hypothetical protein
LEEIAEAWSKDLEKIAEGWQVNLEGCDNYGEIRKDSET